MVQKEFEALLDRTKQAFLSQKVIEYLKHTVKEQSIKSSKKVVKIDYEYLKIENETIEDIYKILIKNINSTFEKEFIEKIIQDMEEYNFQNQASVNHYDKLNYKYLSDLYGKYQVDIFLEVNLLEHTYGLISICLEYYLNENIIAMQHNSLMLLLGCLLHDFGKSLFIQQKLYGNKIEKGYVPHYKASSDYILSLIDDFQNKAVKKDEQIFLQKMQQLADAVSKHHQKSFITTSLEYSIHLIDKEARKRERNRYVKNF